MLSRSEIHIETTTQYQVKDMKWITQLLLDNFETALEAFAF